MFLSAHWLKYSSWSLCYFSHMGKFCTLDCCDIMLFRHCITYLSQPDNRFPTGTSVKSILVELCRLVFISWQICMDLLDFLNFLSASCCWELVLCSELYRSRGLCLYTLLLLLHFNLIESSIKLLWYERQFHEAYVYAESLSHISLLNLKKK